MTLAELFEAIAAAAGEATLPHFRTRLAVDNKVAGGFDPVTEADRAAERAIRALIEREFPDDGIHGEEYGLVRADAPRRWVIDPVDGTRAFITGLPVWGTLVGLVENGHAVAGMMAQPFTGELFYADGTRAELVRGGTRQALGVSGCQSLDAARMFTTTPALFTGDARAKFDRLERAVQLSRYGTDCYAYVMVAAGMADLVVETGLQSYDIAGLIPIIEQAGGVVTTFDGTRAENGGTVIAAASAELHAAALEFMRP